MHSLYILIGFDVVLIVTYILDILEKYIVQVIVKVHGSVYS